MIHVIVQRCYNFSKLLRQLIAFKEGDLSLTTSRADERSAPVPVKKIINEDKITQFNIFPEGRNFR